MGLLSTIGTLGGAYFGGSTGAALGGSIGGMLEGGGGVDTSGYSAEARAAAERAAESAKFKPYSLTTGFGKGFFDTEKQTAGYEIDPRLAAFRDQLYGEATKTLTQLGSTNPEAEAAKYVTQQMGLLQPTREAEDVALRQKMLGSGRMGLGVSAGYVGGDGQGLLNPDQFATQLARERANAQIAAAGTEYGQNIYDKMLSRGTGLMQTGFGVEELGMKPLTIGADIGNRAAISGAQAGNMLLQGGLQAAQGGLAGQLSSTAYDQQLQKQLMGMDWSKSKAVNPFSGLFSGGGSSYGMASDYGNIIA